MRPGFTGCLWQQGDEVFVHKNNLSALVRSNRQLVEISGGMCSGEVVSVDDFAKKIRVAFKLSSRRFVINVGEILPTALLDSTVIEDAMGRRGATEAEQHDVQSLLAQETHNVHILKDVRLPSGLVLFVAGKTYRGRPDTIEGWNVSGFNVFCPSVRKSLFVDSSIAKGDNT